MMAVNTAEKLHSVLFTGGCRSGKSRLAQCWAEGRGPRRVYVATSRGFVAEAVTAGDDELRRRVLKHRADRGAGWTTLEPDDISPDAPLDMVQALHRAAAMADVALVDCVTLWLADWLCHGDEDALLREVTALAEFVPVCPVPLALVSNEVGYGLVPDNAMGRQFRDVAGMANQRLAEACQGVVLAVCGQPLCVKMPGLPRWSG